MFTRHMLPLEPLPRVAEQRGKVAHEWLGYDIGVYRRDIHHVLELRQQKAREIAERIIGAIPGDHVVHVVYAFAVDKPYMARRGSVHCCAAFTRARNAR